MGCCCFSTLRGAAFFVASVHIYNGLGLLLTLVVFPVVFTVLQSSDIPFYAYFPGMTYAVLYFALGCSIFRGIENESTRAIKWPALGFAVIEIIFFILRIVLGVIPTPTVSDLSKSSQPFVWDIYKTLNYFMFTIVGGIVYLCILFLYIQKLSSGDDDLLNYSLPSEQLPKPKPPPPQQSNPIPAVATVEPKKHIHGHNTHHNNHPATTADLPAPLPLPPGSPFFLRREPSQKPGNPLDEPWHQPRVQIIQNQVDLPHQHQHPHQQQHPQHPQQQQQHHHHHRHQERYQEPEEPPHRGGFCPAYESNHHYQSQEPHYQKIPLSPGFNYCLT